MKNEVEINLMVNGTPVKALVPPSERLVDFLRNRLGLTGTKEGCGVGECGACTVLADGENINSCLTLAASMDGRSITTIEGISADGALHPLQQAFLKHQAMQCGFCTPGLIMSAKALLDKHPHPGREEIKQAISGNLCRCTGYEQVIEAIQEVAAGSQTQDTL